MNPIIMKPISMILISIVGLFNLYLLCMSFYLVYVYHKNDKDTCNEEFKKVYRMWHPSMIAFGALLIINSLVGLYLIFKVLTGKNINPSQNPPPYN